MCLTVSGRPGLFDPVGEMTDKVEKEVSLWHGDDFVGDFDEQREAFGRAQVEPLADRSAKVFGPGGRVHLEGFVCIVWEVNLEEGHKCFYG